MSWTARDKERDPWVDRRQEPVFDTVIQVLIDHADVSYYWVDWRPWLWKPSCPWEVDAHKANRPRDRRDTTGLAYTGSMSRRFNDGGGGYLERFAGQVLEITRAEPGLALSEAVLIQLAYDYDWDPNPRPDIARRRGSIRPRLTFDQALRKFGWRPAVLRALDQGLHERLGGDRGQLAMLVAA